MAGSTLPLTPDAFSGRKLGKYEVLCRLSTGGMAEIFLASQRGLAGFRKLVVLKQILPDIKGEEEFVRMFLDEAKVTAAFNHPHIAQVFDLDVAEGELFLALEFVPGATLVEVAKACRLAHQAIPMGLSLASARDTALALHYAHTFTDPLGRPSPVVHRDVAEKNIMVTYEGVTKLLDFGIAKSLARRGRTQVGMVKGTSGYMSPEQLLGEPLDARSDLFSLGVVLHECLTGLRLFHAKTPEAGAGAVLHGQVPPPSRANKAVPPELDAIVLKALARRREDRYASTLEFARALERAVGPLVWHPEQIGELMQRLFADRREQTRQLLMSGQDLSGDTTGEMRLSQIFALPSLPPEPPAPPAPSGLPQITPALPIPSRMASASALTLPASARPSMSEETQVAAPPPQDPPARPPPPPAPRRATNGSLPSVTAPEASPRRRTNGALQPVTASEAGRRSTPEPVAAKRPAPPVPSPESSSASTDPSGRAQPPSTEDTLRKGPPSRPRSASSERVPRATGNFQARPAPPRPAPPPAEEESDSEDLVTRPYQVSPMIGSDEPTADTNETLIPEENEAHAATGSYGAADSKWKGRWGLFAGVALLLGVGGGIAASVALGWDVRHLESLWADESPPPRGLLEPLPTTKPVAKPAPSPPPPTTPPPAPAPEALTEAPQPVPPEPAVPAPTEPPVDSAPVDSPSGDEADDEATQPLAKPQAEQTPRPAKRARKEAKPAAPSPAPPAAMGSLTLVTDPYAKVYLGKRFLGETPFFNLDFQSGRHSLRLVHPNGKNLRLAVEVKSGENSSVRVNLDQLVPD
ncbi:serine/threonine protein kinase [Stigmatella sp. ncwal1]|uniref:Serine/threonine protein kinase n=1 Tax=Stigmatella ashevillensis TaxID=2995309 RepID=A0ABT5DE23_9BACT|nr:serine/threonine-protein kinase [Stigmatella ashevillena]MDC0711930.1 serine/threonine protein kinase [Stigmatella ashevillena]